MSARRCLPLLHRWGPWDIATIVSAQEIGYGFARAFGNVIVERRCSKCGKAKRKTGFLP